MLNTHVIEATFVRRRPDLKPQSNPVRRALITNCTSLLNSQLGIEVLNFRRPSGFIQPYSLEAMQLVLAWDIMWQDYRQFDGLQASIVMSIPVGTPEDQQAFWQYFQKSIYPMTPQQRMAFMDT